MSRCDLLAWDSEFFGRRIARIEGNELTLAEWPQIAEWCARERIECLYFLANSHSAETVAAAEGAGFELKDLRVAYEWKRSIPSLGVRPRIAQGVRVRPFAQSDLSHLVLIARNAHTDTRFFFDRRFHRDKAALLYETWIRRACSGNAEHVLVGEAGQHIAGYLTCNLSPTGDGQIGLVAVDPKWHGQGIGRAMIESALQWFKNQGATSLSVVTQGRNIAAHRFYQSAGFLTAAMQFWYHRWFDESPPHPEADSTSR